MKESRKLEFWCAFNRWTIAIGHRLFFICRKSFTSTKRVLEELYVGKRSLSKKIKSENITFSITKKKQGSFCWTERKQMQNKIRFKDCTMRPFTCPGILPFGTVRVRHHDPTGMDNPVSCNPTCSFNGTSRHAGSRFYALMRGEGLPTPVRKNSSDHHESL